MAGASPYDRQTLVRILASASVAGYLGLFVGTGLSKAATGNRAPSFEELLQLVAKRVKVTDNFDGPLFRRKSFPQIASALVDQLATAKGCSAEQAGELFRQEIADTCNFTPDPTVHLRLAVALRGMAPSWIITTNYDLVLEALIEDAEGVLSTQPLVARPDRIPIYHIHGHRHEPPSIRVTEEDYVALLAPIDYQRLKLPLLLLESATLLLGYAFGDINVRSAVEWSRSFRGSSGLRLQAHQGVVVQALRVHGTPRTQPYLGQNGEFVIEIADLPDFLDELAAQRAAFASGVQYTKDSIHAFLSDPSSALDVPRDAGKRGLFLNIVQNALPYCSTGAMVAFIARVLDPVWAASLLPNAFSDYDTYLWLTLEILSRLTVQGASPTLVRYLGTSLNRVGYAIDPKKGLGSAFAATDRWLNYFTVIPAAIAHELRLMSVEPENAGLARMIAFVSFPP